ncbi:MAG: pyruvate dehydrogenase E2 component (dihydrolipoamide acetyltransferase) [Paracoccaceae bacterium]|jgi:pyruvate dehydrogenase E2 component (dihydrolipoamide acetyltransferase)
MSIKILMPALSPTMTEGNLAKWHVKEGDQVNPGDVIAEIETDKATMEVESIDEGIIGKILVAEGTEGVPVNEIIGILLEDGEDAAAAAQAPAAPAETPAETPTGAAAPAAAETAPGAEEAPVAAAPVAAPVTTTAAGADVADVKASPLARRIAEQAGVDIGAVQGSGAHGKVVRSDVEAAMSGGGATKQQNSVEISASGALPLAVDASGNRLFASPLARRMAAQSGVDLGSVQGSGPDGRIVKRDVDDAIAKGVSTVVEPEASTGGAPAEELSPVRGDTSEIVKLSTMRKVIAQRMLESKTQVPHFYLTMDCELDELLKVRKALNAAQEDVKISVNDFVIRACAMGLMEVPAANVAYKGEGVMRQFHTADISVAVAIPGGLITPIIRAAEQKGFKQISADMKDLATRARDGKLAPEEYQGGSFSVSNLGMFGVKQFDAVINPPQACILAVGAGEQRPVVKDGQIVPATVMSCTLSVDHRVVDGAIGAELLAAIKRYIENPALMLL